MFNYPYFNFKHIFQWTWLATWQRLGRQSSFPSNSIQNQGKTSSSTSCTWQPCQDCVNISYNISKLKEAIRLITKKWPRIFFVKNPWILKQLLYLCHQVFNLSKSAIHDFLFLTFEIFFSICYTCLNNFWNRVSFWWQI